MSDISICNYALTLLSSARIESLTEDSENAIKCNAIFNFVRDGLLEEHDWGFARAEATLALLSDTPNTTDWAYIYQLPTDCLAVRHLQNQLPYKVVADTIYTNHTSPKIIYTKRITDSGLFTAKFSIALAYRIATELAFGITQNATLSQEIGSRSKMALDDARWSDAQQGVGNTPIVGNLIRERQK